MNHRSHEQLRLEFITIQRAIAETIREAYDLRIKQKEIVHELRSHIDESRRYLDEAHKIRAIASRVDLLLTNERFSANEKSPSRHSGD